MATVLKTVIGASQSRVQIPAPPPFAASLAGWLALIAPPIAAIIVTVAGVLTPGYDPITRTVSRLAEPGRPAAVEVDLAVYLVAFALLMLAVSTRPRGLLGVAGCALVVVASVHLDSTSTAATAAHRLASGVAMLALTAAAISAQLVVRISGCSQSSQARADTRRRLSASASSRAPRGVAAPKWRAT